MDRTHSDRVHDKIYYLHVYSFGDEDFESLVDVFKQGEVHTLRLLGAEEYNFSPLYYDSKTFIIFKELCKSYKINLEIINGCNLSTIFGYRYNMLKQSHNFVSWETFYAFQTVERALAENKLPMGHDKIINKYFVSMNGRAHRHRCLFLDHMYKEDLFKHGYVSFHNFENWDYEYEFKYWSPRPMKFDKFFETSPGGLLDLMRPPNEFKDALFSVICESTLNVQFITEKTYLPIWHLRPFLVYGHPLANAYLKSLGFKLFEECIDYSFDSITDDEERCIEFMKQVKNLCSYDINELRVKLMPKVHRNWLNLIRIISNHKVRSRIGKYLPINTNDEQIEVYRRILDIETDENHRTVLNKIKEQLVFAN